LVQASHLSSKIIYLRSIAAIKEGRSNGIPYQFRSQESDEVSDQSWVHGINQPSLDNGVVCAPLAEGWIGWRWLMNVVVDISQLVLARDIHLYNLGPKSIVGAVQLDVNRCSSRIIDLGLCRSFGQNFVHLAGYFGEDNGSFWGVRLEGMGRWRLIGHCWLGEVV
jgi:hypothetical protein